MIKCYETFTLKHNFYLSLFVNENVFHGKFEFDACESRVNFNLIKLLWLPCTAFSEKFVFSFEKREEKKVLLMS